MIRGKVVCRGLARHNYGYPLQSETEIDSDLSFLHVHVPKSGGVRMCAGRSIVFDNIIGRGQTRAIIAVPRVMLLHF
jgi:hypothetical protein